MTALINFQASQDAIWTGVADADSEHAGEVLVAMSGRPQGYMTPTNARSLAADLCRDADAADAVATRKAG